MTAKNPVIKFSPFEALFIGEKNKILKRQPAKNTIFVKRLKKSKKTINLRDLFDLDCSNKSDKKDGIFKMPQRVSDFLKHRKLKNNNVCGFEGCNDKHSQSKNLRANRAKKFKYKENIKNKIMRKYASSPKRRNTFKHRSVILKKRKNQKHLLRGKDGKFIRKSDYLKEISPKQKNLSNYLHNFYLKTNKLQYSQNSNDLIEFGAPLIKESIVCLEKLQFDTESQTWSPKPVSNEGFVFPKCPQKLPQLDFENDCYLTDILYENFPKIVKFGSISQDNDFSDVLFNTDIIKPVKNVRIYKKKKKSSVTEEKRKILDSPFPLVKLENINNVLPNFVVNNRKIKIDEPYNKKNHLISGRSFGSFFFRSVEGKDIFIGNLMKPLLQNSWFGSLPES